MLLKGLLLLLVLPASAQDDLVEFQRLEELYRTQRWTQLIQEGQRFQQRWPLSSRLIDVEYLLIAARVEAGDHAGALAALRRFERTRTGSPYLDRLGYWEGRARLGLGDAAGAELVLLEHLRKEPSGPLAPFTLLALGRAQESLQKWALAARSYEQIFRAGSSASLEEQALLGYSRAQLRLGRAEPAREVLRSFLARPERATDVLRLEYARVSVRLGDLETAFTVLGPLVAAGNPLRQQALELGFAASYEAGRNREALSFGSTLAQLRREDGQLQLMLAEVHRRLGQMDEARATWRRLQRSEDARLRQAAAFNLGLALPETDTEGLSALREAAAGPDPTLRRQARWLIARRSTGEEAVAVLRDILKDPEESARHREAWRRFLAVAQEMNRVNLQLEALDGLLAQPNVEEADQYLFLRAQLRQDPELALADLQTLLQHHPRSSLVPLALYRIGLIYADRSEYLRAEEFFQRAGGLAEGDLRPRALLARGIALHNARRDAQALAVFEQLLRESPLGDYAAEALLLAGRTLARVGREREAEARYRQVIQLNSEHASRARYELGVLLAARSPQEAEEEFLRVQRSPSAPADLRAASLDAALALMFRRGEVGRMGELLREQPPTAFPGGRSRQRYWMALLATLTGDLGRALEEARLLWRQYPTLFLEMEAVRGLTPQARLEILRAAVATYGKAREGARAQVRLAVLLQELGQEGQAQSAVQAWLRTWGGEEDLWDLARILARQVAVPADEALEGTAAPVRAEFLLRRAWALLEQDPIRAQSLTVSVLQGRTTREQKIEARAVAAFAALFQGQIREAVQTLTELNQAQNPAELRAMALVGLGLAELRQGNEQQALRQWEEAARLGPWEFSARALWELHRLHRQRGRAEAAEHARRRLREEFPASPWTRMVE